jgi:uncharacterized protein (TIGR02271 family)
MGFSINDLNRYRGADVYSRDEEKIGTVDQVYVDRQTQQPEWISIGTGFLRMQQPVVPIRGADMRDEAISVPYDKERVKDSPNVEGEQISQETEAALYSHYELEYSERRSDTGLPEGAPAGTETGGTAEGTGTESVTRHEEELRVGKAPAETGRLRLHKWVETEPVETDVELRQETAQVQRERIDQPAPGAGLEEQEVEVPLQGERPVVEKETVAKERVTPTKDTETRKERVSDQVRKERVETEEESVEERR